MGEVRRQGRDRLSAGVTVRPPRPQAGLGIRSGRSVPASPGGGNLSFFGIVFGDARIASVRIQAGNVAPGASDDARHDIVMMDDFIYGEPQLLK